MPAPSPIESVTSLVVLRSVTLVFDVTVNPYNAEIVGTPVTTIVAGVLNVTKSPTPGIPFGVQFVIVVHAPDAPPAHV